jgi:pimeloyl-ACP methyl ester carboxylesterase
MHTKAHDAVSTGETPPPAHAASRAARIDQLRDQLVAALPVTERRLTLNGVPTAVLEGGSGPPIVLLHGPGASGAQWVRVLPDLVTTHRVVAPDLPGHGASAMFDGAPDAERVCAWLDDLIEHSCATPPVLVGHTVGGAIAARYASVRGERLDGLVLVDSLGLVPFAPLPAFGAALQAFLGSPSDETHERLWDQCVFDLAAVALRLGERWELIKAYNLAKAQSPDGMAAIGALMEQFGLPAIPPEALARISVPTTLIWGRHDRATPLAAAENARARYRWSLRVIEDAADDPTLEQPDRFLDALRRSLAARREASHV